MEIICQEYANMQDELAKIYRKQGKNLLITGLDGKIWMITDASFNTDERELVHPIKAPDDQEAMNKAMNILREEPEIMKENQKDLNKAINCINKNAEHLEYHAENMRSHVGATQDLSKATKILINKLERMAEREERLLKAIERLSN
jgi:hypothetical protein